MQLTRTRFALDETLKHLESAGRNPLIESYLVQYLLVSFYSEVEEKVREVIIDGLDGVSDAKVSTFILKSNEGMLKRIRKTDINDVLAKFGCGEGDLIGARLANQNLQPYFDAITNRHLVSH